MARINQNFLHLKAGYLFPEIGRRVSAFREAHPDAPVIKLGVGDVTEPLVPAIVAAMHEALDEMAAHDTFRGYGPERGYPFLVDAIIEHDYNSRGVEVRPTELFVSDGSKCDSGNIQEIFDVQSVIALTDPVYPVYLDSNVMAGRAGAPDENGRYPGIVYLPATADNGFTPEPPTQKVDVAYVCSPNNPTGAVASREYLQRWVDWANDTGATIIFDAAYERFIQDPDIPRSIYEIDGARTCAIEMRSFSKRAGFTGVRCAFTVVPEELTGKGPDGQDVRVRDLWNRRHSTKFNGTAYVVQRGAAAIYTPEGRQQTDAQIAFYMENARILREGLGKVGFTVHGGEHAPYIWLATPNGEPSWDFFNRLLSEAHLVGTPGAGFGPSGEGYFRLSAFNSRANVQEAVARIERVFNR